MRSTMLGAILVAMLPLSAAGCVSQGKYDAAVADLSRARSAREREHAELSGKLAAQGQELARLRKLITEAESRCGGLASDLHTAEASGLACATALDEATALNAGLRAELARVGKDVDALLSSKGTLSAALEQSRARLEELRRAQAAADARAALFRDVALRLKRMIDAGQLQIVLRSGRMVLMLPNDVLFDSGKTQIKAQGATALSQIAAVLSTLAPRRFQVAGHTDDEPIRLSGFNSNWELSAERALSVVTFLIKVGMRPDTLSAAGYGEFDPIRPNDAAENRAQNRRIEITLQPNIDEFVTVPGQP